MPAKDIFHDAVKNALIKEGWMITHDPFSFRFGDTDLHIDLAAERVLAAEKGGKKIAVEIKGFAGDSPVYEFHLALGQFMNYQLALDEKAPERILYLAVPADTYRAFFHRRLPQAAIQRYQLRLLVFHPAQEEIAEWIN